MDYPSTDSLIRSFAATHRIMHLQTSGLSHQDSVLQPPFRANCLNWVLGHILVGRNRVLELLGESTILDKEEAALYNTGSEPITHSLQALHLEKLLSALDLSQQRITGALERISPEDLARVVPFRGGESAVGQAIASQHWHETYHTGQLELLRQLAGTDDKVI